MKIEQRLIIRGFVKAPLKNDQGIALVVVIMIVALLLSLTGAGLLFSALNLKTAGNIKTGSGAIHVADAGVQHALALIPSGGDFDSLLQGSVSDFPCASPCNGTQNKPTLTGSLSGYTYTVVVENDSDGGSATDDTNRRAILISTATGPNDSKRTIKAYIGRSNNSWAPPGTLFVPGVATDLEFEIQDGATITGNDYNVDGSAGPNAAIPGIATNSADATSELASAITTPSDVTGAGGTPSVVTTSSTLDVTALANDFLSQTHTTLTQRDQANVTLGTWDAPQITYLTNEVRFTGNSSGAGVLIVDGDLEIEGTFNFKGLIILRNGGEMEIEPSGASTIYGGILVTPGSADSEPELEIEGPATIRYSSQAISKVSDTWSGLPQKAKLIAWHEVMQ